MPRSPGATAIMFFPISYDPDGLKGNVQELRARFDEIPSINGYIRSI